MSTRVPRHRLTAPRLGLAGIVLVAALACGGPAERNEPSAGGAPVAAPTPAPAATPHVAPTPDDAPETATPATTPEQPGQPIDARKVVVGLGDLGAGWAASEDEALTRLEPADSRTAFDWAGSGGLSPEGLAALSAAVRVLPDDAAARAAMKPLPPDCDPISAPEVGERSRAYTRSVDGALRVVYVEAVVGSVWVEVGVTGSPQAETKVTTAADLARLMIARLP